MLRKRFLPIYWLLAAGLCAVGMLLAWAGTPAPAAAAAVQHSRVANDNDLPATNVFTETVPTATPSPTALPTALPTELPPTQTPSATPLPSQTPSLTPTPVPTHTLTPTLTPTASATPTATPPGYLRPLVAISGYSMGVQSIQPGSVANLQISFRNLGQATAHNVLVTFQGGGLLPLDTGGLIVILELDPGEQTTIQQSFSAPTSLAGSEYATVSVQANYMDAGAGLYSDVFELNLPLEAIVYPAPSATAVPTPTPTSTPANLNRPQLVVSAYDTGLERLEAGMVFQLSLSVKNLGLQPARQVTLIFGGGEASYAPVPGQASGITAGNADLSNFAPLGSSNLLYLGDLSAQAQIQVSQGFIVNASTQPGAYSLKVTFTYFDAQGNPFVDDQIITLLVHRLPRLDVSFYRPPDPLRVGQPGMLPLQVVNQDRASARIGNLQLACLNAQIEVSSASVGTLEEGGYFTQDVVILPTQAGLLELVVTLEYFDDFNQLQSLQYSLNLEVVDSPAPAQPPAETSLEPDVPQTGVESARPPFLTVLWRLMLGFLGLDSRY
ncbi:MAG: hypothetical protein JW862_16980 [Anaerolineales bacterium]|nr:hypothetical protein [Anaerolineales bacterium]